MDGLETTASAFNLDNKTWLGVDWNETGDTGGAWANETKDTAAAHVCGNSAYTKTTKTIAWGTLLLLSFLGNVLVIAVVQRSRDLKRATVNLFIINMSASDLIIPFISIPYNIKQIYVGFMWFDGEIGSILCKLVPLAIDVSTTVSILTLVVVAMERFQCVVYPTKPPITIKTCRRLICLIWLFAAASHSFYLYSLKVVPVNSTTNICVPTWHRNRIENFKALRIQAMVLMTCLFHIPLVTLTVLYTTIIVTLRQRKLDMVDHLTSTTVRRREQQNRKVAFMLIAVVVVFVLAYLPFTVFVCLLFFKPQGFLIPCELSFIVHFLFYSYSVINPVVYYYFNHKYRRGFEQLLSCRCHVIPTCWEPCDYHLRGTSTQSETRGRPTEMHRHSTLTTSI